MKDWIKKNKDAIIISGLAITGTALVVGVTYRVTATQFDALNKMNAIQMVQTAHGAGVLDTIIAHQDKLQQVANV